MRILFSIAVLALSACASLPKGASDALGSADVAGTRFGLVVMTMDGREVVSVRPDERFLPASNTKLFTVAAAFRALGNVSQPNPAMGLSVRLEPREGGPPDIVLIGGGDALALDADDCEHDCLPDLVHMATAMGVTEVHDVIGDDQIFPEERWGPGWSVEDMQVRSGAPASAIVINSNEVRLEVKPGAAGQPVAAAWRDDDQYFQLVNEAMTIEGDLDKLHVERLPGSNTVRLYGTLGASRPTQGIPLAVEDPALTAAWRMKRLLEERGVKVSGAITARHRQLGASGEGGATHPRSTEIARLLPPPLIDDIRFLLKQSQNLHAEVLLHLVGSAKEDDPTFAEHIGAREKGLAVVEAMLNEAGADRRAWDFSDGSGLSAYNRVTPRMMARFIHWTTSQPWATDFRSALAVGGVDGTISRRFRGTPLEGHIFAKTGTLNATNSLSGFMETKSGQTLIFAIFANDRPSTAAPATNAMDQALLAIAAAH
ncbi:MAG TPA: D-alanyl-D-alanine carboxypeptidase/D-alanyl-D-alanine-endopeptidase [Hyphomonadaceae bacterium]|nr:D-alanyl-D-alanine carboxypeptidase/D-alanyl-D-alanine-endopeptidase [Hyphomonadaceae bacterium]